MYVLKGHELSSHNNSCSSGQNIKFIFITSTWVINYSNGEKGGLTILVDLQVVKRQFKYILENVTTFRSFFYNNLL
jgi:hypothetical protein